MKRRDVLKAGATLAASSVAVGTATAESAPSYDIDIYVSRAAYDELGASAVNSQVAGIESLFAGIDATFRIGPEKIVDVPAFETAKDACNWWRQRSDIWSAEALNLLMLNHEVQVWQEYSGWADIDGPCGVINGATWPWRDMRLHMQGHEIGHMMGLDHPHADDGTIMQGYIHHTDVTLDWSPEAVRSMESR